MSNLFSTLQTRVASYIKYINNRLNIWTSKTWWKAKCCVLEMCSTIKEEWPVEALKQQLRFLHSFHSKRISSPNGVFPTRKAVLEDLLHFKDLTPCKGQLQQASSSWLMLKEVVFHWIFWNIYPKTPNRIFGR